MAISTRPISGRAIAGDIEDTTNPRGIFKRQFRVPVSGSRYDEPTAEVVPAPEPSPIYDSLNPAEREAVDRLVVGYRMSKIRGVA